MYTLVLSLHSWLRWVALLAGIAATFTTLADRATSVTPRRADLWGLALMVTLDLQMLLGLLLYFVLSPFTAEAMRDFGAAMRNPGLRFFAVEHLALMLAAVILAHVGRVLARKAPTPEAKRTRMLVCFGLATVLMVLGIPWPGMANGRPLFRL
jgi:heme A synthase